MTIDHKNHKNHANHANHANHKNHMIYLIRPKYHTHLITPPLGLGYLSSYLKTFGHDVMIIDGLLHDYDHNGIAARVKDADLVGINCLSDYFPEVIELGNTLKNKGLRVVIGGPHATALPDLTLSESGADGVIVGEGEITLKELCDKITSSNGFSGMPGLYTREGASYKPRGWIRNLDSIPFPDWAQIDPARYKWAPHGALIKRYPVAPVISTRGCCYGCKFCASPRLWGGRVRFRSPEGVVEEIQHLIKDFGVREIHFEDDNLTLRPSHIEAICKLILKRRLDISWATPNGIRAENLSMELLNLMRRSGCCLIAIGIESANPEILKKNNKTIDLEDIRMVVRNAKKTGMITQGFFIFGLPGETRETVEQTIVFSKEISLDRAQFLLLDILPGSELWRELSHELVDPWGKRSYQEVKWQPPTVSRKNLERAPRRAFKSFYFRPRILINLLRFFRPSQTRYLLRRLRDFRILRP